MKMLKTLQSFRQWAYSNPLRAGMVQFTLAPCLYLLLELVFNPTDFFVNPSEGLGKLILLNTLASIGMAIYIWSKNRGSN